MMISYPGLAKFKTNMLKTSDVATLEQLKELSAMRKALQDSMSQNSPLTQATAREISGGLTSRCEQVIQKLELYLPLLENLLCHFYKNGWNRRTQNPYLGVRWCSALAASSLLIFPIYFEVCNMYMELAMAISLYGAMLREQGLEVLSSDLVQSAMIFRKAAGVYDYLAQKVVPHLVQFPVPVRPPEATSPVASIMSLICLADAQAVTARKAEEDGKSGTLIAKLHYGITEYLVEAIDILQAKSKEYKDLSSRLLDFLLCSKTLHELKSCKHLVISLKDDGKIGVAIGLLRQALAKVKKSCPKEESWKLVLKQFIEDLNVLLQKYKRENDFVWYEKIPRDDELPLPQSVKIVSLIPYEPQKWERKLVFI